MVLIPVALLMGSPLTERRLGVHDHARNDIVVKRSADGGKTWSVIKTNETLPSVACMGSVVKGATRGDGWDLWGSFRFGEGEKNGQIVVSKDFGQGFEITKNRDGSFWILDHAGFTGWEESVVFL